MLTTEIRIELLLRKCQAVFFDPSKGTPEPMDDNFVGAAITEAMGKAGIAPEYIYASRKTGLIPTTANENLLSDADLEE